MATREQFARSYDSVAVILDEFLVHVRGNVQRRIRVQQKEKETACKSFIEITARD